MPRSSTRLTFVHFAPCSEPCAQLQLGGLLSRPGGTPDLQQTTPQILEPLSDTATYARGAHASKLNSAGELLAHHWARPAVLSAPAESSIHAAQMLEVCSPCCRTVPLWNTQAMPPTQLEADNACSMHPRRHEVQVLGTCGAVVRGIQHAVALRHTSESKRESLHLEVAEQVLHGGSAAEGQNDA